jgi:hypothetical protein
MAKLILQPAVGYPAPANVAKSLKKPLALDALPLAPEELASLRLLSPDGAMWAWGCTHDRAWRYMEAGDLVLFMTSSGLIAYRGTVAATMRSKAVAAAIWGSASEQFQFVYFLVDVNSCSFDRGAVNMKLQNTDSPTSDPWQQVRYVHDQAAVDRVFELVGKPAEMPSDEDDGTYGLTPEDGVDGSALATVRKEHRKLKKHLFQGKLAANCAICGKLFPREFLVTAHLKKRAACDVNERIDPRVVLPMCSFGCDSLYEQGLLSLSASSNSVVATRKSSLFKDTETFARVDALLGMKSPYPLSGREHFLGWHNKKFGAEL